MRRITPAELYETIPPGERPVVLDVRSPGEYALGRLPGAVSLPLFSDAERAEVGTLYKQSSPDDALLRGLEIAGGKMRTLVEAARAAAPEGRVAVHCWRGGQRSASVGWLLERAGMDVMQVTGGYKAFRQRVRAYFTENHHRYVVLGGATGSGKTYTLRELPAIGEYFVDLEGLANHKGSSFGAIGEEPQPSVEEFENQLYAKLLSIPPGARVWLEDESQRIGRVYLPHEFYNHLSAAPVIELVRPREWRLDFLTETYGGYPDDQLAAAFTRLRKKLGGQHLQTALEALERHDYRGAAAVALVYYDKAYRYHTERRGARIVGRCEAGSVDHPAAARQLVKTAESFG